MVKGTVELGLPMRCMATVNTAGLMVANSQVTSFMESKMEMGHLSLQVGRNTRADGEMAHNTAKEFRHMLTANQEKVFGKMEREQDG
jgi:hypothetical protein